MLELGGFDLKFVWASNFNIRASSSNIKAYKNFRSKSPNSNMVFLSRVIS
jgi:hypothetical protein